MPITITSDGNTIKIDDGLVVRSVAKVGTGVFVNPLDDNEVIIDRSDGRGLTYNYSNITVPTVASAEELREEIVKIINLPQGMVGIGFGLVPGMGVTHKYGEASDIDIADNYVDIWDGAGDPNADKTYTFSTSADIDTISSSSTSDTGDVQIIGLDGNWDEVTQTVTLEGRTKVSLSTPLVRVYKMKNLNSVDIDGCVYCYVDGDITAGVPDTSADIRAIIQGDNNRTLMAIYTIPAGKEGAMCSWVASLSKKKDAISNVRLYSRSFGGVFELIATNTIAISGSSLFQRRFVVPKNAFLPKTDIIMKADTSTDDNGVSGEFEIILRDL